MMAPAGRILKPAFFAITLALALLALRGAPSTSAGPSDLAIEQTCGPEVFRPNVWVAHQCLIRLTNNGDTTLHDFETSYSTASGVIPDHYFVFYGVLGQPLPIEPTGLSFGVKGGALQPGQSADVRLVTLLKMPREGAYDGEWVTRVDGEVVPTTPLHYEALADAVEPPTDLRVSQTGYREDTRAVFETTIINDSQSAVAQLSVMEHYGPTADVVSTAPGAELVASANLLNADLTSLGKDSLAPGETLTLRTVYESQDPRGYVQSGVLVEAIVDGRVQLYGSSAGSVCVACGGGEEDVTPQAGGGGGDSGSEAVPPSSGDLDSVAAPATGEGPSSTSIPVAAHAALAVTGVAVIGMAQLVRRMVHHG